MDNLTKNNTKLSNVVLTTLSISILLAIFTLSVFYIPKIVVIVLSIIFVLLMGLIKKEMSKLGDKTLSTISNKEKLTEDKLVYHDKLRKKVSKELNVGETEIGLKELNVSVMKVYSHMKNETYMMIHEDGEIKALTKS